MSLGIWQKVEIGDTTSDMVEVGALATFEPNAPTKEVKEKRYYNQTSSAKRKSPGAIDNGTFALGIEATAEGLPAIAYLDEAFKTDKFFTIRVTWADDVKTTCTVFVSEASREVPADGDFARKYTLSIDGDVTETAVSVPASA